MSLQVAMAAAAQNMWMALEGAEEMSLAEPAEVRPEAG
jgi:hypothetical protein